MVKICSFILCDRINRGGREYNLRFYSASGLTDMRV